MKTFIISFITMEELVVLNYSVEAKSLLEAFQEIGMTALLVLSTVVIDSK